jgi:hypothetical protein
MAIFLRRRSRKQIELAKKGKVCPECNSRSIFLTEPGRDRKTYTCRKCGTISTFTAPPPKQRPNAPPGAPKSKTKEFSMFSVRETAPLPDQNPVTARFNALENETIHSMVDVIRKAMENSQILSFTYTAAKGQGFRSVEPYKLTVKGADIVLFAHDLEGDGIRIFKLGNMSGAELQEYAFNPRHQIEDKLKDEDDGQDETKQK